MFKLHLDSKEWLLLGFRAAAALVCLGAFKCGHESVRNWRRRGIRGVIWRGGGCVGGGREAVEGDGEAELEGAALKGVGRRGIWMGADAGLPEMARWRREQGSGDVKRRRLPVAPAGGFSDCLIENRRGLRR